MAPHYGQRPGGSADGPRRMERIARLAAAVLLLALAGCGQEPPADTGPEPTTPPQEAAAETRAEGGAEAGGPVTTTQPDPAPESAGGEAGDEPESIGDFLGFDFEDTDATEAFMAENERRAQELTAVCMAGEGFEYVPFASGANIQVRVLAAPDDEESVRQNGFGITTGYGTEEQGGSEMEEDPNDAIVAAMSESEREAYLEALFGPPEVDDSGVERRGGNFRRIFGGDGGGCLGQAYAEVMGAMMKFVQTMAPALQEMNQRLQADPRVEEANRAWSVCMGERGYTYESQDEVFRYALTEIRQRFEEIVGSPGGVVDPFEGWTEEQIEEFLAENTPEEIEDFFQQAQDQARAEVDQEALVALQQEERDLAVANFLCGEDLSAVLAEVRPEYEQKFITENREQLEPLRSGTEG